ncbi:MAG: hypothetical protein HC836_18020 [Richelia sp. RM2_1_2]|nr:hypothetical protein [Richelia sp. RM2_1_2]
MKPPIEQAKEHILKYLIGAGPEVKLFIVPCYRRDYEHYSRAVNDIEVQTIFKTRGIQGRVEIVSDEPEILIATVKDVAEGRSDAFLRNYQKKRGFGH